MEGGRLESMWLYSVELSAAMGLTALVAVLVAAAMHVTPVTCSISVPASGADNWRLMTRTACGDEDRPAHIYSLLASSRTRYDNRGPPLRRLRSSPTAAKVRRCSAGAFAPSGPDGGQLDYDVCLSRRSFSTWRVVVSMC